MSETRPDIRGSSKLVDVFGYWPSFHDAEVLHFSLDHSGTDDLPGPTAEASIHVFEITREVDPNGFCVLQHHSLVNFRFHAVVELELRGFWLQNQLWELEISSIADRQLERVKFDVKFFSSVGMSAQFQCHSVEVVSVEAFTGQTWSPPQPLKFAPTD